MENSALKPKVVLGIAAHPDDIDFGFAGSIARWANDGAEVYYLILTDGSKGSADRSITSSQLVKMREAEQRQAAKSLGARDVFFLGYPDGELEVTIELKKQIVRYIRRLKPDVVLSMDPSMIYSLERGFVNHPDHRTAGQAALDAIFPLARDYLTFPDLAAEGLGPHKVSTVLLVNFEKHNFAVDISSTLDKKLTALSLHASQMPDFPATKKRMTAMGRMLGKSYGYACAEAFVRLDLD